MSFLNVEIYGIGYEIAAQEGVKFRCRIENDYAHVGFVFCYDGKDFSVNKDISLLELGVMKFPKASLYDTMIKMVVDIKQASKLDCYR